MGPAGARPKILLLGEINQCVTKVAGAPLNTDKLNSAQQSWKALGELGELVESTSTNRADFIRECQDGKFEGVVAVYRTFFSFAITGQVDEELVNALPSSLQYISHCGMTLHQWPPAPSSNLPSIKQEPVMTKLMSTHAVRAIPQFTCPTSPLPWTMQPRM